MYILNSFKQRMKPLKNDMEKIKTNIQNTNKKTFKFIWKHIV